MNSSPKRRPFGHDESRHTKNATADRKAREQALIRRNRTDEWLGSREGKAVVRSAMLQNLVRTPISVLDPSGMAAENIHTWAAPLYMPLVERFGALLAIHSKNFCDVTSAVAFLAISGELNCVSSVWLAEVLSLVGDRNTIDRPSNIPRRFYEAELSLSRNVDAREVQRRAHISYSTWVDRMNAISDRLCVIDGEPHPHRQLTLEAFDYYRKGVSKDAKKNLEKNQDKRKLFEVARSRVSRLELERDLIADKLCKFTQLMPQIGDKITAAFKNPYLLATASVFALMVAGIKNAANGLTTTAAAWNAQIEVLREYGLSAREKLKWSNSAMILADKLNCANQELRYAIDDSVAVDVTLDPPIVRGRVAAAIAINKCCRDALIAALTEWVALRRGANRRMLAMIRDGAKLQVGQRVNRKFLERLARNQEIISGAHDEVQASGMLPLLRMWPIR